MRREPWLVGWMLMLERVQGFAKMETEVGLLGARDSIVPFAVEYNTRDVEDRVCRFASTAESTIVE